MKWFSWWVEPLVVYGAGYLMWNVFGVLKTPVQAALFASVMFWGLHGFRDKPLLCNAGIVGLAFGAFLSGMVFYEYGIFELSAWVMLFITTLFHIRMNLNSLKKNKKPGFWGRYFRPKPFEKKGAIYEKIGIKCFKRVLMTTILGPLYSGLVDPSQGIDGYMDGYEKKWSRIMEIIHGVGFLLFIWWILMSSKLGFSKIFYNIEAVFFNFYFWSLQRYNRAKIQWFKELRKSRPKQAAHRNLEKRKLWLNPQRKIRRFPEWVKYFSVIILWSGVVALYFFKSRLLRPASVFVFWSPNYIFKRTSLTKYDFWGWFGGGIMLAVFLHNVEISSKILLGILLVHQLVFTRASNMDIKGELAEASYRLKSDFGGGRIQAIATVKELYDRGFRTQDEAIRMLIAKGVGIYDLNREVRKKAVEVIGQIGGRKAIKALTAPDAGINDAYTDVIQIAQNMLKSMPQAEKFLLDKEVSHPFRFPEYIWQEFKKILLEKQSNAIYQTVKTYGLAWTDKKGKLHWIDERLGKQKAKEVWLSAKQAINTANGYTENNTRFVKKISQIKKVIGFHEKVHALLSKQKHKRLIKLFRQKLEGKIGPLHKNHPFILAFQKVYGKPYFSSLRGGTTKQSQIKNQTVTDDQLIDWCVEEFIVLLIQEQDLFEDYSVVVDRIENVMSQKKTQICQNIRKDIDDFLLSIQVKQLLKSLFFYRIIPLTKRELYRSVSNRFNHHQQSEIKKESKIVVDTLLRHKAPFQRAVISRNMENSVMPNSILRAIRTSLIFPVDNYMGSFVLFAAVVFAVRQTLKIVISGETFTLIAALNGYVRSLFFVTAIIWIIISCGVFSEIGYTIADLKIKPGQGTLHHRFACFALKISGLEQKSYVSPFAGKLGTVCAASHEMVHLLDKDKKGYMNNSIFPPVASIMALRRGAAENVYKILEKEFPKVPGCNNKMAYNYGYNAMNDMKLNPVDRYEDVLKWAKNFTPNQKQIDLFEKKEPTYTYVLGAAMAGMAKALSEITHDPGDMDRYIYLISQEIEAAEVENIIRKNAGLMRENSGKSRIAVIAEIVAEDKRFLNSKLFEKVKNNKAVHLEGDIKNEIWLDRMLIEFACSYEEKSEIIRKAVGVSKLYDKLIETHVFLKKAKQEDRFYGKYFDDIIESGAVIPAEQFEEALRQKKPYACSLGDISNEGIEYILAQDKDGYLWVEKKCVYNPKKLIGTKIREKKFLNVDKESTVKEIKGNNVILEDDAGEIRNISVYELEEYLAEKKGMRTLYATTSVQAVKNILLTGNIVASRVATERIDKKIEELSGEDQTKEKRSVTSFDRDFMGKHPSYFRLWGSIKNPLKMSIRELKSMSFSKRPEVTLVFEEDEKDVTKPAPWKSWVIQPSARYIANKPLKSIAAVKRIIIHTKDAFDEITKDSGLIKIIKENNIQVSKEAERLGRDVNQVDSFLYLLRIIIFYGVFFSIVFSGKIYFILNKRFPELGFISGIIVITYNAIFVYTMSLSNFDVKSIRVFKFLHGLVREKMKEERADSVPYPANGPEGVFVQAGHFFIAPIKSAVSTTGLVTCCSLIIVNERKGIQYLAHINSIADMNQIRKSYKYLGLDECDIYVAKGAEGDSIAFRKLKKALKKDKLWRNASFIKFNNVGCSHDQIAVTLWNGKGYLNNSRKKEYRNKFARLTDESDNLSHISLTLEEMEQEQSAEEEKFMFEFMSKDQDIEVSGNDIKIRTERAVKGNILQENNKNIEFGTIFWRIKSYDIPAILEKVFEVLSVRGYTERDNIKLSSDIFDKNAIIIDANGETFSAKMEKDPILCSEKFEKDISKEKDPDNGQKQPSELSLKIVNELKTGPKTRILSLCAKDLVNELYLAEHAGSVTAIGKEIDINADSGRCSNLKLIKGDIRKELKSFNGRSFDIVVVELGLHYFDRDELAGIFRDISRLLVPEKGHLCFTVRSKKDWQYLQSVSSEKKEDVSSWLTEYYDEQSKKIYKRQFLDIERIKYYFNLKGIGFRIKEIYEIKRKLCRASNPLLGEEREPFVLIEGIATNSLKREAKLTRIIGRQIRVAEKVLLSDKTSVHSFVIAADKAFITQDKAVTGSVMQKILSLIRRLFSPDRGNHVHVCKSFHEAKEIYEKVNGKDNVELNWTNTFIYSDTRIETRIKQDETETEAKAFFDGFIKTELITEDDGSVLLGAPISGYSAYSQVYADLIKRIKNLHDNKRSLEEIMDEIAFLAEAMAEIRNDVMKEEIITKDEIILLVSDIINILNNENTSEKIQEYLKKHYTQHAWKLPYVQALNWEIIRERFDAEIRVLAAL
ncbi:MAG: hypothetical protein ABH869_02310 [Candidatus Omnitrophota bacterium]